MRGFHDMTLLASNVGELREFYKQLGFHLVVADAEDMAVFTVGDNEFVIHTAVNRPTAAVGVSIRVDDTGPYQARLEQLGIPFEGPKPLRPGLSGISLKDPNGNVVEFLQATG